MHNLMLAVKQLETERARLNARLQRINTALSALGGKNSNRIRRGTMSAAGRARVAAAQRARWAKVKGQKIVSIASRKRRRMSPAAIARIRAAQKARWAKWRKSHKG